MGTFTKLSYHVVFGTKFRRKTIQSDFSERMYEFIGGIIRRQKGVLFEIGGIEDHIHILLSISPTIAVSDAVRELKAASSKWVNELPDRIGKFEWQKGYGAFTVSHSQIDAVREYVSGQAEHHRIRSFQEEYEDFLQRHGITYDPRYLFEAENHG